MTFTIKIKLGNAAMQTGRDLRDALNDTNLPSLLRRGDTGTIRDLNGNTVGTWKVG